MIFCFNTCLLDNCRQATYKMNEIVNKLLLAGDKFMPVMHLKQPGFTYSAKAFFNMIWLMEILKV